MTNKETAIKACEFLEARGGWVSSHRIFQRLGATPGKGQDIRKVLTALASKHVLEKQQLKSKFAWRLVDKNWNREDPFKPISSADQLPMDQQYLHDTKGETIARFDNPCCRRCGQSIAKGTPIENWAPGNGKTTWVHKGCERKTLAEEVTSYDKAMQDVKQTSNDHASKDEIKQLSATVAALSIINDKLLKRVEQLEKTQPPREILLIKPDKKKVKLEQYVHPIFEQVMFHIQAGDNVMLVGPRGSGKTTLAEQIAKALDRPYGMLSLSGGVTEGKLFGRVTPDINTGKNTYHRALFTELFEEGGVFLLDEVDAADPNVLLSVNSGLANGQLALDRPKNPMAQRHGEFVCLAAANTWGNGADRQYVGRNQQDTAFTERFVQLAMDYDKELERALCPGADELLERLWKYRGNIASNRLERTVSTRFICRAYHWLKLGKGPTYVDQMVFAGWRADEIQKVKGGVL